MRYVSALCITCFIALMCLTSTTDCAEDPCKPVYWYWSQFAYDVSPSMTTPKGIKVDPSGQHINPARIDRLTDETERCLIETFGNPPKLPPDVVRDGKCQGDTFALPPRRQCITVKVPNDWHLNCDKTEQVLPQDAPVGGCEEKGEHPSEVCHCHYRAGLQNDQTIVTTPNMLVYKDPLIRIITGCGDPWHSPPLAKCATPTTGMLDDGSGP